MDSMDLPLWIKVVGVFGTLATILLLAARNIIFAWISARARGRLRLRRR